MSAPSREIGQKVIVTATKWSFSAEFTAKMIVPVTNMILARLLTPEAFGLIATINMVISFTDMFTESGFGQFLVQHIFSSTKELYQAAHVAFWTNLSISLLLWAFIGVFRHPIAELVGSGGYSTALVVACASLPLTSFSSIPMALFQRKLDYKSLFYNRLVASFTPLVVSTALALCGFGYWSLIAGTLCSHVVKAVVLMIRSDWRPHLWYCWETLRSMFQFSIWILLEATVMWCCTWIDIFIISKGLGTYYTGLYKTVQTTVTGVLSIITASVNSILFSSLSRVQNDEVQFQKIFYSFQYSLAILVVPMGIGMYVFRDTIVAILLGSKWIEASDFLGVWGLCTAMVATMGTFCREALRAKGLPKKSLAAQFLHLVCVIPVCIWGVNHGFHILIYVRSLAYLQIIPVLFIFIKIYLNISPIQILKNTAWPFFCAIGMGGVGILMRKMVPQSISIQLVLILVCVILYFGMLSIKSSYRADILNVLKKAKFLHPSTKTS